MAMFSFYATYLWLDANDIFFSLELIFHICIVKELSFDASKLIREFQFPFRTTNYLIIE